ncbi:unnamed protein product [Sympodiomycopsis kandeliae]
MTSFNTNTSTNTQRNTTTLLAPSLLGFADDRPPECPPCFNCQLDKFACANSGVCRQWDGSCDCTTGFGGQDCLSPLCGSPLKGQQRYPRQGDDSDCECDKGWQGLNCNVCQNDSACSDFILGGERLGENGTCYTGGSTVSQSFQQCEVTNKKITDMLPGRPPKVTFSCDKRGSSDKLQGGIGEEEDTEQCNFQFWIGQRESFYCDLQDCSETLERTLQSNNTKHTCTKAKCSCIPGRMLCGEAGSIDIGDFLSEEIKGPASMTCKTSSSDGSKRDCRFEEPAMNDLISSVFGDSSISLSCKSGECIHYSQEPGYKVPLPPPTPIFWVAFSAASALLAVGMIATALWLLGRHAKHEEYGSVRLPEDEAARLLADHIPASLSFRDLSYRIQGKTVLQGITGTVKPGEIMAIVGASGAGKTTFLDLLARREKTGKSTGTILINGRSVSDSTFKRISGFVDQEDCLMSTLTVYETVLYSALLRLPREMSIEAKRFRTLETLQELGILHIKDSRIGDSGQRSISGGEKRRVSIACELVQSPDLIFLDEPTSGLDSGNALNVIECLVNLAQTYRRTVVLSLHQPSSKIVSLLDKLILLSAGRLVYSGHLSQCVQHFADIGQPCPEGHNILEYLIDLTAAAASTGSSTSGERTPANLPTPAQGYRDEEDGPQSRHRLNGGGADADADGETTELHTHQNSAEGGTPSEGGATTGSFGRAAAGKIASGVRKAFNRSGGNKSFSGGIPAALAALVDAFHSSTIAEEIRKDIQEQSANASNESDVEEIGRGMQGYQKASLFTQLRILSGRSFKNLYRNPQLMLAHYALSFLLGGFIGLLFYGVTNDIAGFQNRLGLCFFTLALFGFSTLTSLGIFANERQLFVRERANGYYSPLTYFAAKLLFDNLPLRVVPPLLFGPTIYFTVGLVPQVSNFWCFILTLVLFSLAASSIIFFISISIKDTNLSNLVGTLTMLISLLFAGLLINKDKIPSGLTWLLYISPFHASYEALLVNELKSLSLKERKYGIEIDVPASVLLSSFGFDAQAYWRDNVILAGMFTGFTLLSATWLVWFVRERR